MLRAPRTLLAATLLALCAEGGAAAEDTCPAERKAAGPGVALLQKAHAVRRPGRSQEAAQATGEGRLPAPARMAALADTTPDVPDATLDAPEDAIALSDVDALLLNEALAAEASGDGSSAADLERQIAAQAGVDMETALEVVNSVSAHETPEQAAEDGRLVDVELVANLTGVHAEENCAECFEGDILAVNESQLRLFQDLAAQGKSFAGTLWREGKVDYCYAADVHPKSRELMEAAFAAVRRALPCLTFTDVGNLGGHKSTSSAGSKQCGTKTHGPAIFIESKDGVCNSYIGMLTEAVLWRQGWKAQTMNLAYPGCYSLGIGVHEIMHALGMDHEQNRNDRYRYVNIKWENIATGKDAQFQQNAKAWTGASYDYLSVMHYSKAAFSKNGQPTILTSGGAHDNEIGQRVGLSQSDANQLQAMYDQENSKCVAQSQLGNKMGCTDTEGNVDCSKLSTSGTTCENAEARSHCCACGSGIDYRCWEGGSECRVPSYHGCMVDKSHLWNGRYGCVVRNSCSHTVEVRCAANRGLKTRFWATNRYFISPFKQLCEEPAKCTVRKLR